MRRVSLTRYFAKPFVNLRIHRQGIVVLGQQFRYAFPLLRGIERGSGNIAWKYFIGVEVPLREINIAESPQPGVGPGVKPLWREFAGQFGVAGREESDFVQRPPVARCPRKER